MTYYSIYDRIRAQYTAPFVADDDLTAKRIFVKMMTDFPYNPDDVVLVKAFTVDLKNGNVETIYDNIMEGADAFSQAKIIISRKEEL